MSHAHHDCCCNVIDTTGMCGLDWKVSSDQKDIHLFYGTGAIQTRLIVRNDSPNPAEILITGAANAPQPGQLGANSSLEVRGNVVRVKAKDDKSAYGKFFVVSEGAAAGKEADAE